MLEIIGVIATLVGAGVAVVTLYSAYNHQKINIVGVCDVRVAYHPVMHGGSGAQVLYMSATNIGFRNVTISGVSLKIKRRKFAARPKDGAQYVFFHPSIPGSSQIPATLAAGESAKWFYEMQHIKNELITKKPGMAGTPIVSSKKDAKSLVCEFRTTYGKEIFIKPDPEVIRMLIAALP